MRLRKWNKTTILWDCFSGMDTNVPVDDWHKPDEHFFHKIYELEATSCPDQKGELAIGIKRVSISPTTQRLPIHKRLEAVAFGLLKSNIFVSIRVLPPEEHCSKYCFVFTLRDGAGFCDAAIHIVSAIYQDMLRDKKSIDLRVANFKITQETFAKLEDKWISFANWLRINHRLPVHD